MPGPSSWPCSGRAGLEAEGVACPEPGRSDAGGQQRGPQGARRRRPARRTRRRPRRCSRCRRPRRPRRPRRRGPTPNRGTAAASGATVARRVRAWGPWTAMMHRSAVVSSPPMASHHPVGVGGVGHDVEGGLRQPPDDDVVDHRAVGVVEQVGVLGPARAHPTQVVGEGGLEPVEGVGTLHPDGAQVAHVEDHRVLPAGPVLGDGARPGRPAASPSRRTPTSLAPSRRWASIRAVCRSASPAPVAGVGPAEPAGCRPRRKDTGAADQAMRATADGTRPSPARPYLARRARVSRW